MALGGESALAPTTMPTFQVASMHGAGLETPRLQVRNIEVPSHAPRTLTHKPSRAHLLQTPQQQQQPQLFQQPQQPQQVVLPQHQVHQQHQHQHQHQSLPTTSSSVRKAAKVHSSSASGSGSGNLVTHSSSVKHSNRKKHHPRAPLRRHELSKMPVSFGSEFLSSCRRVLCYGDSLTAGFAANGVLFEPYGRAMAEKLGAFGVDCQVSICGLSGKTAKEMVQTASSSLIDVVGSKGKGLARTLEEEGPFDLVMIMAGTNDMGHGHNQPDILQDVEQLHRFCHERGVPTLALAPPPAPVGGSSREVERKSLVASLRSALLRLPGTIGIVDPADIVPSNSTNLWEDDGLHFSPEGSRQLGAGLATLASARLASPRSLQSQLAVAASSEGSNYSSNYSTSSTAAPSSSNAGNASNTSNSTSSSTQHGSTRASNIISGRPQLPVAGVATAATAATTAPVVAVTATVSTASAASTATWVTSGVSGHSTVTGGRKPSPVCVTRHRSTATDKGFSMVAQPSTARASATTTHSPLQARLMGGSSMVAAPANTVSSERGRGSLLKMTTIRSRSLPRCGSPGTSTLHHQTLHQPQHHHHHYALPTGGSTWLMVHA